MAPLEEIKARLFARRLRKERERAATSPGPAGPIQLRTAQRITVLFPADNAEDRKAVESWKPPGKEGRRVTAFGYFTHEVGATNFSFKAVTLQDLNWYGVPEGQTTEDLRGSHPDLLIRLGPPSHAVLDYLAAITPAGLKVGPDSDADNLYHLRFFPVPDDLHAQLARIEKTFTFINE
ncbi:hypothetical protein CLV84_2421 [Neolewinella xylanilytica]|uniref:Uncharacterized protein n=1 Tax=Neolewinella xylanilytica TaxID=1514080 RepID=A0A2S6I2Z5_9BACT|nr:hypothetical protein [Neolewinella xylanilytica]PPK85520.1 hypothetical protein CLV84_2421 [Neolewinella xylanilytica]